jgi:hypothetical protein
MAIEGVQSGVLLRRTGLNAGQAYQEMADLLLHGPPQPGRLTPFQRIEDPIEMPPSTARTTPVT